MLKKPNECPQHVWDTLNDHNKSFVVECFVLLATLKTLNEIASARSAIKQFGPPNVTELRPSPVSQEVIDRQISEIEKDLRAMTIGCGLGLAHD